MKKKLLALGMATCLALSGTTMAFGADQTAETSATIGGSGSIEGYVEKDMFVFTAPTTSDVNFKIDPQELLRKTAQADTLDGSALAEGYGSNVMFSTTTANAWATSSQDITVVNKGQFDIDVTVNAKVTGLTKEGTDGYDIQMVDDSIASYGEETAISMKITPSTSTLTDTTEATKTPVTSDIKYLDASEKGVTVKQKVAAASDNAFKIEKDATSGNYKYVFVDDLSTIAFNEVVFNLSGTVNTDANWKNFNNDATKDLKVELTYTVEQHLGVETMYDIKGKDKGFVWTILKADVTGTPTTLFVNADNKWYNLSDYATVSMADKGKYYEITVTNWNAAPADGSRNLSLADENGTSMIKSTVNFRQVVTMTEITGANKGFTCTVLKSDLSDTPKTLQLQADGKWYDFTQYSTVNISEEDDYYEITVSNWTAAPDNGSRPIRWISASGATLYSGTVTFGS